MAKQRSGMLHTFEWDEAKNLVNIRKHGIDFRDVPDMFERPLVTRCDDRVDYGEQRWVSIGWLKLITAVVVYAEQRQGALRIISARKATRWEVKQYVQCIKN